MSIDFKGSGLTGPFVEPTKTEITVSEVEKTVFTLGRFSLKEKLLEINIVPSPIKQPQNLDEN
jgi:hypothetical protein